MQIWFIDQHVVAKEDGADGAFLWIKFKTIKKELITLTPHDATFAPMLESLLNFKKMSDAIDRNNEHLQLTEEEVALKSGETKPSAEVCALNNFLAEELKLAFMEISPAQARRFLLHHAFGYSHKEIACMEGCSVNASWRSVRQAKKNLQKSLKKGLQVLPLPTTSK
jgi:hypothetical protein